MTPFFLQTESEPIFCNVVLPTDNGKNVCPSDWVLCFPPFAEELNKSRKMLADQARNFTQKGFGVLMIDYAGTGDSGGELVDASWAKWQQQTQAAVDWLLREGAKKLWLFGLRGGCLVAAQLAQTLQSKFAIHLAGVIFWQPVLSGNIWMTQFLRLRLAADLVTDVAATEGDKERLTVSGLRAQLARGETVEVAGYRLGKTWVEDIDGLKLSDYSLPEQTPVYWFEVSSQQQPQISVASTRVIEHWREQGIELHSEVVSGAAFWATQEIAVVPALLTATGAKIEWLNSGHGSMDNTPLGIDPLAVAQHRQLSSAEAECALSFTCAQRLLIGILHKPDPQRAMQNSPVGVVVVVGGPQYRVGSHRQFVELARALASSGVSVLRMDYRGMGDAEGEFLGFESIGADIRAGVDELVQQTPGLQRVVLWGLCDGATAAAAYAPTDSRVQGLVLLNPWVRSEVGEAKAYLKHYYLQRLISRDFWQKVSAGGLDIKASMSALTAQVKKVIFSRSQGETSVDGSRATNCGDVGFQSDRPQQSLSLTMGQALQQFSGKVLLILSAKDLTAAEFKDALESEPALKGYFSSDRVTRRDIAADHTFSRREWKSTVEHWTKEWIASW